MNGCEAEWCGNGLEWHGIDLDMIVKKVVNIYIYIFKMNTEFMIGSSS